MRISQNALRTSAARLCLVGIGLSACSGTGDADAGVARVDSAGVEIVTSPGEDVPLEWDITETFRLGGAESGIESFFRIRPEGVTTDADGNIFVLDAGNFRILKFDPTGEHMATFGGEGGGPGEFQFPFNLAVAPDGTILVLDFGKRGLVRFDAEGQPIEQLPLPDMGVSVVYPTSDGLVIGYRTIARDVTFDTTHVALFAPSDTTPITHFVTEVGGAIQLESCGIGLAGMGPVLSSSLEFAGAGDRLAVNRRPEFEIDIFDGVAQTASYRRSKPNEPATKERAVAELGEGMNVSIGGGERRVCDTDEVVEKRGIAALVPHIANLAMAPDGSIWIQRKVVGNDPGPIDIMDPTGVYVGTLPANTPFPVAFLPSDSFLAIERDDLGVEFVVAYRVGAGELN